MKVILLKDIQGTGKKDQILEVSDGYARNYLFPRKLAQEASAGNLNAIKNAKAAQEHKRDSERKAAETTAKRLGELMVTVPAKAGAAGRLFGSVTTQEIAEAMETAHGVKVDKRKIVISEPIKSLGDYEIEIKLFSEITARLKITIVAREG